MRGYVTIVTEYSSFNCSALTFGIGGTTKQARSSEKKSHIAKLGHQLFI